MPRCRICYRDYKSGDEIKHIIRGHNIEEVISYIEKPPRHTNVHSDFYYEILEFELQKQIENIKYIRGELSALVISEDGKSIEIPYSSNGSNEAAILYIKQKDKFKFENLKWYSDSEPLELKVYDDKYIVRDGEGFGKLRKYLEHVNIEQIYITWDNLYFSDGALRISYENYFFQPYRSRLLNTALNQVREEHFRRHYSNEVYRICIDNANGAIIKELKDFEKLERHILDNIPAPRNSSQSIVRVENKIAQSDFINLSTEDFKDKIEEGIFENTFLSIGASMTRETDKIIGLCEDFNGQEEEALVFVYHRNNYKYLLWENSNPRRAAYLFTVRKDQYKSAFGGIKSFIEQSIELKRHSMYTRTVDIKESFEGVVRYSILEHQDQRQFKEKLWGNIGFG